MDKLMELWRRLLFFLRREKFDRELEEEMRFHLEMKTLENLEACMSPEEAHYAALRKFGNVPFLKEVSREMWGMGSIERLAQDLRYGTRMLRRSPSFTAVAALALALGIGANTAIFSVINAVLLRPLPYKDTERIVAIKEWTVQGPAQVTPANFLDWREQNKVFEEMAAVSTRRANLTGQGGEPQRINLAVTSANFFQVLGVQPLAGRAFLPTEEQAGHEPVVVVSDGLWKRHFGSDPNLVGKPLMIDGETYIVVGVMPAGVQYPQDTELWIPPRRLVPEAEIDLGDITQVRGLGLLAVIARLKPGVTLREAQAEMDAVTSRLRAQYPETNGNRYNTVISLHESLIGDVRPMLLILLGAVGCVLLIACANVANLLLARASARQKEMAIRTALGAHRWRIVRQLLTESMLLALMSGTLGLLLAVWGVELLSNFAPASIPRIHEVGLDSWVLIFTLLVSIITGFVFGLVPALQVSKTDLNESLKEGARGATSGARGTRFRSLLVVSEIALSLVLLIGAGLLLRSFIVLQAVEPGFEPRHVLTMRIAPSGENYREADQQRAFYEKIIERIKTLPGVQSVGAINTLPLGKGAVNGYVIEGRPLLTPDKMPGANRRNISSDYFRAMNIPLLKGRTLTERDNADAPGVVIINESLARRDFAGENPVGKRLGFGWRNGQPVWLEIVGVVGDVRSIELNTEPTAEAYTPYLQNAVPEMSFVIRTAGDPTNLAPAVRHEVRLIDQNQPVSNVKTMERVVFEAVMQPRFNTLLLGIFAAVALLLAAAGIYGVMAYSVTMRTHEIGVRMALGARPWDVLKLVMGQGARLTLAGLLVGLLGAFAATRVLASVLFGISPTDPLVFIGVGLLLTGVALAATYIPARRAMKLNPLIALRYE